MTAYKVQITMSVIGYGRRHKTDATLIAYFPFVPLVGMALDLPIGSLAEDDYMPPLKIDSVSWNIVGSYFGCHLDCHLENDTMYGLDMDGYLGQLRAAGWDLVIDHKDD